MSLVTGTLRRTLAAFAVGFSRQHRVFQRSLDFQILPLDKPNLRSPSIRLMSTFQAPVPPSSKGEAVYSDIKISVSDDLSSRSSLRNNDPGAVFVITGASRGIGLQFVKSLIDRTKGTVVACCRSPESASGLNDYISSLDSNKASRVRLVQLDLEDQSSVERAGAELKDSYSRVDILLNVAGILGDAQTTPGPERSIGKIDRDWLEKTMAINLVGPVMFSKELVPLMAQRKRRGENDASERRPNSVIANLSARVGSISDNGLGGWYSYRMSKTALNQATRTMSHELKRQSTWTIALHPGTTDTGLSKPFQRNVQEGRLFPVDFTVTQLLNIIDSMEEENSGGLYDWAGKTIPF